MSLVSVIVPVYNALSTLPRCVQSVLAQSHTQLELLLVDDGSTDGSSALCDQLAAGDARIRVIHKENGGVSSARNRGLDAVRGQWVIFLDADDALSPAALESALLAASQHPNMLVLWPAGGSLDELPRTAAPQGRELPTHQLARLQLQNCLPMPWNKLYSAHLLQRKYLRFDPAYTLGEDLLFCLDYCKAMFSEGLLGFYLLDAPLTFYDQSIADSLTHRLRLDFFPLWQELYNRLFTQCLVVFHCPEADVAELRRAALDTIAFGASDVLERGQDPLPQRRRAVRSVLRHPWIRQQRRLMRRGGQFSLYEPGILLASPRLIQWAVHLRQTDVSRFYQLQYTGQAIRLRLHPAFRPQEQPPV